MKITQCTCEIIEAVIFDKEQFKYRCVTCKRLVTETSLEKLSGYVALPIVSDYRNVTQAPMQGKVQSIRQAIDLAYQEHFELGCKHAHSECSTLKTLIEIKVLEYCKDLLRSKAVSEFDEWEELALSKDALKS